MSNPSTRPKQLIVSYSDRIHSVFQLNGGQASTFNSGFSHSSGEILGFLDADDVFAPDKVSELVRAYEYSGDVLWCFDNVARCNEQLEPESGEGLAILECRIDVRNEFRRGSLAKHSRFRLPPTSGLSFRRSLLEKILPMPTSSGCQLSDDYSKFLAIGLSPGILIGNSVTKQRIHSRNIYTQSPESIMTKYMITILTGYWLARRFPEFKRFADTQIAYGIHLRKSFRLTVDSHDKLICEYLSATSHRAALAIKMRALGHDIRSVALALLD